MTLIPTAILTKWETRTIQADKNVLANLVEFLEFYDELQHGELMQAYTEAAKANRMSGATFRDKFGLVRRFRECDLYFWFANGISFDHLDKAPSLAEITKRQPSELIAQAIEVGNKDGETMTVDEMTAFALGETDKPKAGAKWHIEQAFVKVWKLRNILGWDDEKANRFEARVRELIEEFIQ